MRLFLGRLQDQKITNILLYKERNQLALSR